MAAARTTILSILVITTAASLWCVSSSSSSSSSADAAAAEFVKKTVSSHKIAIFSKSYCPYSLLLSLPSKLFFVIPRSYIYIWFHCTYVSFTFIIFYCYYYNTIHFGFILMHWKNQDLFQLRLKDIGWKHN